MIHVTYKMNGEGQGDSTLGGKHTTRCTDDVLWSCTLEICTVLLTNITPVNSISIKDNLAVAM